MALASQLEVLPSEQGFAKVQRNQQEGADCSTFAEIEAAHARANEAFRSGRTKTYEWRVAQLTAMRKLVAENTEAIVAAVHADIGRPSMENFLAECTQVVSDIDHTLQHLKSWMQPEVVSTPLLQKPARSVVIREPKGVVLVITPWNFPFNLSMASLIAVLSAGNCAVLKPSEVSLNTERLLKTLIPRYLDADAFSVVTGGVPETSTLLKLRWDHIFYTGSGVVGRIIMRAAAEHLTPCTLELGGKSPTVVLPGAKISQAAKRILATKCFNAGQICISPDYILAHEDVEAELVKELQATVKTWFGEDASTSKDYGKIINKAHFNRIKELVQSTDGEVLPYPGEMNEETRFIPPIFIRGPSKSSSIMQEEIFGPAFPILKFKSVGDMVEHINAGDKPLAMYIFGTEKDADEIISRTSSGGVCVNDTMFHMVSPELPFGGVGGSGMGHYHGRWGFNEFSHARAVMYRATWIDLPQRYRPYSESDMRLFERIIIGPLLPEGVKKVLMAAGGAAAAGAAALIARRSRL